MNKELGQVLKAFNKVVEFISEMPLSYKGYNNLGVSEYISDRLNEIEEALNEYVELKKALTPPTAEEVCDMLSECLRFDKYHSKCIFKDNNFYERCDDGVLETIVDNDNGLIDIYFNLPPHLITLIGRFYEGESK